MTTTTDTTITAELDAIIRRHDECHEHPGDEMCDVRMLLATVEQVRQVARRARGQETSTRAKAAAEKRIGPSYDLENLAEQYGHVAATIEQALADGLTGGASDQHF